jgi:hypothetical protein
MGLPGILQLREWLYLVALAGRRKMSGSRITSIGCLLLPTRYRPRQ